jgi:predicted transcriptional regulator
MKPIPSAADVAAMLKPMSNQHLERLASLSGVPYHTLLKIRSGETENPRIDTVRQFLPHVRAAMRVMAS